jgi:hypothetical protein
MDWLRSEDLKEEKVMTTSNLTITRRHDAPPLAQTLPRIGSLCRAARHSRHRCHGLQLLQFGQQALPASLVFFRFDR